MEDTLPSLTIGALAAAAEVGVETIRFYQRRQLLDEPPRPPGGIRRYGAADTARVRFIKSAQRLGFRLDEVAGLLVLEDGTHCDAARALAEHRLTEVQERLHDLHSIESALRALIARCGTHEGQPRCPMIAALQTPATPAAAVSPRRAGGPGSA